MYVYIYIYIYVWQAADSRSSTRISNTKRWYAVRIFKLAKVFKIVKVVVVVVVVAAAVVVVVVVVVVEISITRVKLGCRPPKIEQRPNLEISAWG